MRDGRGGGVNGTMWLGWAAIAAGFVLLGLCFSQWDGDTGSTIGGALRAYHSDNRAELATMGAGALQQSSHTALEGVMGLFWLVVGGLLVRKATVARGPARYDRREPPRPRR